jgi:MOSC domain-containing protein YiiM
MPAISAKLVAICVGKASPILLQDPHDQDRLIREISGIQKTVASSLSDPVAIICNRLGLVGDEQADLSVHGGPSKAVYCYPVEHYEFWKSLAPAHKHPATVHGWAGENLCVTGLTEHNVWIGDRLAIGSVIFSVSAPRAPCYKFNHQMGVNTAAKQMVQRNLCGWYLHVIQEGELAAGQEILVTPGAREITVAQQNKLLAK